MHLRLGPSPQGEGPQQRLKNCCRERAGSSLFKKIYIFICFYLFIWLHWVLAVAHRIFSWGTWDLVPRAGIEPGPPALGERSLSHWIPRQVPDAGCRGGARVLQLSPTSLCATTGSGDRDVPQALGKKCVVGADSEHGVGRGVCF